MHYFMIINIYPFGWHTDDSSRPITNAHRKPEIVYLIIMYPPQQLYYTIIITTEFSTTCCRTCQSRLVVRINVKYMPY